MKPSDRIRELAEIFSNERIEKRRAHRSDDMEEIFSMILGILAYLDEEADK